jgi:hypothetical protein
MKYIRWQMAACWTALLIFMPKYYKVQTIRRLRSSGTPTNNLYGKKRNIFHSIFNRVYIWVLRLSRDFTCDAYFLCVKDSMFGGLIKRTLYRNKPVSEGTMWYIKTLKQSHYSLLQARKFPGGSSSRVSKQSTHEVAKIVNPTYRPPLPRGNIPSTRFSSTLSMSPGTYCGRKDYANENFQWQHRESKPRLEVQWLQSMNSYRHCISLILNDQCFLSAQTTVPFTNPCVLPLQCSYLICVVMQRNSDHFLKDYKTTDNCKR